MSMQLTILTLNAWGIPYVSADREIRMAAIGDELAKGNFDVVSLQEVWDNKDYQFLRIRTKEALPYSHYFHSGAFGSGLCIFSKYPIISAFFHAWSVNGYVHRIQHGDWFGGKGVGLCRILVDNKIVNVYIAHLHAEYDNENDEYKAHRVIQAFDTAQFIESTYNDAALQILAGDLNTEPNDIAYKILLRASKMQDTCTDDMIGTNDCKRNTYSDKFLVEKNPEGKRIDHIFIRTAEAYQASIDEYTYAFPERVPGQTFSFSDHEGISVKLKLTQSQAHNAKDGDEDKFCEATEKHSSTKEALLECISICNESLLTLKRNRIIYISMGLFLSLLLFALVDVSPPYIIRSLYLVLKILLTSIVSYFLFMGTLWNIIEKNGVLSGKLSMEIALNYLDRQCNCD